MFYNPLCIPSMLYHNLHRILKGMWSIQRRQSIVSRRSSRITRMQLAAYNLLQRCYVSYNRTYVLCSLLISRQSLWKVLHLEGIESAPVQCAILELVPVLPSDPNSANMASGFWSQLDRARLPITRATLDFADFAEL